MEYQKITLNHANLNVPLSIVAKTIGGYHFAPTTKCTHVYTIAGVFPAKETPEEIDSLLKALNQGDTK